MATKDEIAAAAILSVIDCLKEGQEIQRQTQRTSVEIRETLAAILEGQNRIEAQLEHTTRRTNAHDHSLRVLEYAKSDHEQRIKALEARPDRPARTG